MPYKDHKKQKEWYEKNKSRLRKKQAVYEKRKAATPEGKASNALRRSRLDAKRRDIVPCNISVEALVDSMTGVCGICGKKESETSMCMDHCHTTGNFRGWLCSRCNMGLGYFNDDHSVLQKATDYLDAS